MKIRHPAVSGLFYPAEAGELKQMLSEFLHQCEPKMATPPKALIVPHAGYVYSGQCAANAYIELQPIAAQINSVVLLGPSHRIALRGIAACSAEQFVTPLGAIPQATERRDRLLQLPQVTLEDEAHISEHSLEVQLPFLQLLLGQFELLPLVVGRSSEVEIANLLQQIWGGDETLIVVSSDLSHYHSYQQAQQIDRRTSEAILNKRSQQIGPEQACGCYPLNGLLHLAREKGLQIDTLQLCNSGDTAAPRDRVVGYGAYALH